MTTPGESGQRPTSASAPAAASSAAARAGDVRRPVSFNHHDHVPGPFFHGTAATLAPGDELVPGYGSNFQAGRVLHHIYFTALLDTAAWGAELATALTGGQGRGHVYLVEPQCAFEDDPNVTDKRMPGNPTQSYRTHAPLRVTSEIADWPGHDPKVIAGMLSSLQQLRDRGDDVILD